MRERLVESLDASRSTRARFENFQTFERGTNKKDIKNLPDENPKTAPSRIKMHTRVNVKNTKSAHKTTTSAVIQSETNVQSFT
jgi:hypothetical protein